MNRGLSDGESPSPEGVLFFHKRQEIGGHALVMAVVFVFFLTLFGLAFYQFAETDVALVGNKRNAMGALYAAQAGFQKAAWIVKHHSTITREDGTPFPNLNPFSPTFYSPNDRLPDFQEIVHRDQGMLSPVGELPRYFRINRVDARGADEENPNLMACVRVQVLGAVDVDGDGDAGLDGTDSENFPIDPDDVNRKFEAIVGLPGSLGQNISAGAPVFTYGAGAIPVDFTDRYEQLRTQDGYTVPQESGFYYYERVEGWAPGWDQYGYIFGKPIREGEIDLPPDLFDGDGTPVLTYFSGLGPRQYDGNQVFHRDNDPTSGDDGRDIVYVNGDVRIQGVNFGHLDNSGVLRGCDWERTDVTIVSTGTLTARDIQCGDVGRLTLIAKDILLVGDDDDTRINGVVLASGTITLDDQETPADPNGCPHGVLKDQSASEPIRYSAYLMGTMLAGTSINLRNAGWTVLFDEKVINGLMYDTTLSKPTLVYETAEGKNFYGTCWYRMGDELEIKDQAETETYTPQEISDGVAASWDLGGDGDGTPNVIRVYQDPIWEPGSDDHDYGVTDGLELDLTDIGDGSVKDWSNYRALTFWMSLDNFRRVSGSEETRRISYFEVQLSSQPGAGEWELVSFFLSEGQGFYDNTEIPGDGAWKRVRIPLGGIDPIDPETRDFDIKTVYGIEFWLYGFEISWYHPTLGVRQWIDYDPDGTTGFGDDGRFVFHLGYTDSSGMNEYPVRFWPLGPADQH